MDVGRRPVLLASALLVALTLVAYGQVWRLGFISFDDPLYVSENQDVLRGLDGRGLIWALTAKECANWHPLTWVSLMADATLGGANPRIYHATNLALHLANTLLLFLVLRRMTGCTVRSAFVAALFAVHPLHVESVAWVSERKDVLSTLLWMLTLGAYARYAERPEPGRYLTVAGAMALGLTAKPMLVSLPGVLLLLDYWPLGRVSAATLKARIVEKLPLFGLSCLSAMVTLIVQRPAMEALERVPFQDRLANGVTSYAVYVWKTIWPAGLAIFYPFPRGSTWGFGAVLSWVALVAISAGTIVAGRRRPWLPVGWLWYVLTLVPVLGIIQVGSQARADRYTYVPLIGLFILASWSVPDLSRRKTAKAVAVLAAAAILMALSARTWGQLDIWRSDLALFSHAAAVTRDNAFAQFKIGEAYAAAGDADRAAAHYREALRIQPEYSKAHFNLAGLLARSGRLDEAEALCREEAARWPTHESTLINLGVVAYLRGRRGEAVARFEEALRRYPESAVARHNLDAISPVSAPAPPSRPPSAGSPPDSTAPRRNPA